MAKIEDLENLGNLTNETSAVGAINANNDKVEAALDNTLSRDGSAPNQMEADLDLNGNNLLNVGSLDFNTLSVSTSLVVAGRNVLDDIDNINTAITLGAPQANFAETDSGALGYIQNLTAYGRSVGLLNDHFDGDFNRPYASRAVFEAATVPATVIRVLVRHDNETFAYRRNATGTAITSGDGANWSPDGQATVGHWGATRATTFGDDSEEANNATAFIAAFAEADDLVINAGGAYYVQANAPLGIRNGQSIRGLGYPSASQSSPTPVDVGSSKIFFTGAASAGFGNADTGNNLLHASITNLTCEFEGAYNHMMNFNNPIGCDFSNLDFGTEINSTGGMYSRKIGSISWVNNTYNVRIRLPTGGLGRTWDVDFGDSTHVGLILGGGVGGIDGSTGGNKYIGGLWNNCSGPVMTFQGSGESGSQNSLIGVQIEENTGTYDVVVDGDASNPVADSFYIQFLGCRFRSSNLTAAIGLINVDNDIRTEVSIVGNIFAGGNTPAISVDRERWAKLTIQANHYRAQNFDIRTWGDQGGSGNTNLVIDSVGEISITGSRHKLSTFSAAATDNLDTISGGFDGQELLLSNNVGPSRLVVVRTGVGGNINLNSNCTLTNRRDRILLIYDGIDQEWHEISRNV